MDATGQRIATNVKGDIRLAVPQRTQSYDKWIEVINNEFLMSLANPSLKLGLEQGFTKATSETAREMFESKIASMRRIIKRQVESLWVKVLEELGFDSNKAEVKLHFGSQEIEYDTEDLFKAVELKLVTPEEARTILREYMKWRLEGTLPEPIPEVTKEPEPQVIFKEGSFQIHPSNVKVEATEVKVQPKIEVHSPDITVKPPSVKVDSPDVHIHVPKKRLTRTKTYIKKEGKEDLQISEEEDIE